MVYNEICLISSVRIRDLDIAQGIVEPIHEELKSFVRI